MLLTRETAIAPIAGQWASLSDSLFSLPNWLATAEVRNDGPCHYLLLDGEDGPRGGLVAYEMGRNAWFFNNPVALLCQRPEATLLEASERELLSRLTPRLETVRDQLYPALVSVLPSGYLPGLLRPHPVTGELLDALERLAGDRGLPTVAVMHVPEGDAVLRESLVGRGYLPFVATGDCVLRTPWTTFEDYLASLPTRRRNRVRREERGFADSGAVIRESTVAAMTREHAGLHASHMRRYGHDAGIAGSMQLIESIQANPTGRGRVLEAWRGNEMRGFLVFYELDRVFHPKMIGIADGERFTYFNLTYYALIRTAVAERADSIVYGPESYEVKALRGCSLEKRVSHVLLPEEVRELAGPVAEVLDRACRRRLDAHSWAPRAD